MSVAGDLAEFLAQTDYLDLPPPTTEYAAMLIASTLASAALGRDIASSVILRELARERGGAPQASAVVRCRAETPGRRGGAGQRRDE